MISSRTGLCDALPWLSVRGAVAPASYPSFLPYDLEYTRLSEYRKLVPRWPDGTAGKATCLRCATLLFDGLEHAEE